MGRIDDPSVGELADIKRRLGNLEARTPLSDSSVSGGRTRFIGDDSFGIEGSGRVTGTLYVDGTEIVDGTLRVTGTLTVSGPATIAGDTRITGDTSVTGKFTLSGPATIDGDTTVTGAITFDGDTDITGTLTIKGDTDITGKFHIKGDTTLSGDMTVDDNGKITVGGMVIGKSGGRGRIDFGTAELASDGSRVALQAGSAIAGVRGDAAMLLFDGNGFVASADGLRIADLPVTSKSPNLYIDPDTNKLYRSSATDGTEA